MPKQPAFPGFRDAMKKKVTRREQFLAEMDAVAPPFGADRAVLSEGWAAGWEPADAIGALWRCQSLGASPATTNPILIAPSKCPIRATLRRVGSMHCARIVDNVQNVRCIGLIEAVIP
jgi:hypothetical protein